METDKGDWEGPNGTKQLFQDAKELYSQTQDVEAVQECLRLQSEMHDIYAKSEQQATLLIRQYTERVEDLRKKAEEFAAIPASTPQIEALKTKIQASLANIDQHEKNHQSTEKAVEELEQQLQNLQLEHEAVEKSAVVQVPLMKHSLSLYANITKIKWDFSSDNIAGSMVNTDTGKVKTFEFVEEEESPFSIANKIWDLIEA